MEMTMTADEFRNLALAFPETVENAHMSHPDFRVRGKIFATLGPGEAWGMVKLTPEQQALFRSAEPAAFKPAGGAWGQRGCTIVNLDEAKAFTVRKALSAAWCNNAPKDIVQEVDGEMGLGIELVSISVEKAVKSAPKLNKAWHAKHKMPAKATLEQRMRWHLNHRKHCGCRPIPKKLATSMKAKGLL